MNRSIFYMSLVVLMGSARFRVDAEGRYDKLSPVNGRFGQFAYRDRPGSDDIDIDPAWLRANMITIKLPKIGRVYCNKLAAPYFNAAFATIQRKGLLRLVRVYSGLWSARYQRHTSHIPEHLSNHSWGTAIDLNFINNRSLCLNVPPYIRCKHDHKLGSGAPSDENVTLWKEAFQPAGFAWGAMFSPGRRDPMHFEVPK